ncbi:MAG: AI-2E family transporter [Syntrophomonas sp.]|uniref:AI-2E family transporter n=1 Tax=Syntrophomonas sp. TaxID=2053627 RepID=UPI002637DBA6|nr:AI-2E family transporter [Syntrophomonas sp.]MDD2510595.1 AI-2E family transporter [Syntrophomonas sp.]MDD3878695.1 AI-2E family transporter [Syntrophomonas sp.]MDD4626169.1 AI-2E family transporter [Syntrophomonas sp.]
MLPASSKIYRYFFFITVVLASIYFLFLVREVLLTFFLGAVLAYLLFRPTSFLEKKGLKRVWAILVLYLVVLAAFFLFFSLAVPAMVVELHQMAGILPDYAEQARDMAKSIDGMELGKLTPILKENLKQIENKLFEGLKDFLGGFYSFLGKFLALAFSPILAFYIINDWEKIRDAFLSLFSPSFRRDIKAVLEKIDEALIEFLKGHLIIATFVGIFTGVAATLLGVKFPLLIGLIAGVADLVPYFGAFLGGFFAIFIALSDSMQLALYMGLAVLLIQQVESNIITPRIMGGKLGMHPLLIVFALLAGGKLMGIWGMLLAVPLAATLKVLAQWVFLKMVES